MSSLLFATCKNVKLRRNINDVSYARPNPPPPPRVNWGQFLPVQRKAGAVQRKRVPDLITKAEKQKAGRTVQIIPTSLHCLRHHPPQPPLAKVTTSPPPPPNIHALFILGAMKRRQRTIFKKKHNGYKKSKHVKEFICMYSLPLFYPRRWGRIWYPTLSHFADKCL